MKRFLLVTSIAVAATFAGTQADAAPIVHDTSAEFDIVNNQGTRFGGGAIVAGAPNNRTDIESLFDASTTTVFSLGFGGSLELKIKPAAGRSISGATTIELTSNNFDQESTKVLLGNDFGGYVEIGTLFNGSAGWGVNQDGATTSNPAIATLSAVVNGDTTNYEITVLGGPYNTIKFVDASVADGAVPTNDDGFDLTNLSVTSNLIPVPEPASMALLGAGLLGLGLVRRRRRA